MITNFFTPLEFIVTVKRLPNVEFFTQRVTLPGISANAVRQPTRFNAVYQTPDELQYDTLNFSFIIDENMKNFIEIFNWMTAITFPQRHSQFKQIKESEEGLFSDISIIALNSHKNPVIELSFKNCFPINLSEITMDTTNQDVTYPEATVVFQYDWYEIKSLRD